MPPSSGSVELDVQAGRQRNLQPPEPDTPFRIAILGDFSGRESRGIRDPRLDARKILRIDRDNFEEVLARLEPQICLPDAGMIRFKELEDFHPDRLYDNLAVFRLAERQPVRPRPAAPPPARRGPARLSLDDLVASTEEQSATRRPTDELSQFVDQIVAPHLVPRPDPVEAEARAAGEAAASIEMRAILHHPAFQALEAAWQGAFFLVRRLETGAELQVHLIDISKAELAADLLPAEDLTETQLWRLLVERTVGAQPWSLLVGNYEFDSSLDDVDLLARVALAARAAGAPFLAGASPRIVGAASIAEQPRPDAWRPDRQSDRYWARLRQMPEAQWVGLALPRFLLRLPYGAGGSPIERFAFEERPEHEDFLWANPAFACACLIGQAFTKSGWSLRPGAVREVPELPAYVFKQDGESVLKPCAEALMTEHAANEMLDRGLMPLATLKGRDVALLVRFQSIADPPAALAGRWIKEGGL